jgi:hypothetical protein
MFIIILYLILYLEMGIDKGMSNVEQGMSNAEVLLTIYDCFPDSFRCRSTRGRM